MYRVIVDGQEVGKYKKVSYAKKIADGELEIGGFFAEIYKGNKIYASKSWDRDWR